MQHLAAQYDDARAARLLTHDRSEAAEKTLDDIKQEQAALRPWPDTTQVSHLLYHSPIRDPPLALAKDQPQRVGYAQYMVTIGEFRAQLKPVYQHGYVLVHPQRLVTKDAAGTMRPATLMLPPGKKPLVLSVDDVNYCEYMTGAGFASNLALKDGHVTGVLGYRSSVRKLDYSFSADTSGMSEYSSDNKKFAFLRDTAGFDNFFPIDAFKPAWSQLTDHSWRQARINVDGFSMQRELDGKKTPLEYFFTTASTNDPERPLPLPESADPLSRVGAWQHHGAVRIGHVPASVKLKSLSRPAMT